MRKTFINAGLLAVAGSSAVAFGQAAPSTAQTWEMRYKIERFGLANELLSTSFATAANPGGGLIDANTSAPYATDVSVGLVRITMQARVAIRQGAWSTTNLGIGRVGGPNTGTNPQFRLTFTDAVSSSAGLSQGTIGRGLTGEGNDVLSNPLRGAFSPFRSAFNTGGNPDPNNVGSNSDANNGIFTNPANGALVVSGLTAGRGFYEGAFGGAAFPVGSGGVNANGELGNTPFGDYYSLEYTPRFTPGAVDPNVNNPRLIGVSSANQTATYIFAVSGNLSSVSSIFRLQDFNFQFAVPTPGAAALLGLGGLAMTRRRR